MKMQNRYKDFETIFTWHLTEERKFKLVRKEEGEENFNVSVKTEFKTNVNST